MSLKHNTLTAICICTKMLFSEWVEIENPFCKVTSNFRFKMSAWPKHQLYRYEIIILNKHQS